MTEGVSAGFTDGFALVGRRKVVAAIVVEKRGFGEGLYLRIQQ
jgi:hypothetical protein